MPAYTRSAVTMLTDFFAADDIEATARRPSFVQRMSKMTGKRFLARVTLASAIIRLADEWPADLIVVGAQGRSVLGRLMLGSVSQKVVTSAACSVRIARGRPGRNDASRRIAVCVDGAVDAAAAVRAVAKRVWPDGTEACVFAVRNRYWSEDDVEKWYHGKVDAAVDELRTAGLTASSVLREGHPQRALPEEIARWGADCVFVGSRGLGQVKRFLLGSVSAAVAVRAQCSVEVVRTAAEE
jgi:nucleotide-binding universal stress UspA family protein